MTARFVFTCDSCGAEGSERELEILTFRDDAMDVIGHLCGSCAATKIEWREGTPIKGRADAIRFRAEQASA